LVNLNTRIKVILNEILITFFLIILYKYPLSSLYSYSGFVTNYFDSYGLIISILWIVFLIVMGALLRNEVYYFVYHTHLIMVILPGFILYVFAGTSIYPNLFYTIPLFMFLFFDILKVKSKLSEVNITFTRKKLIYILILVVIMLIPFLTNLNAINLNNLLLKDIYNTRLAFRESKNVLMGYLMSPLSRYILPFLAIYSFKSKNLKLFIFTVSGLVLVFLTSGALKGLIFSFLLVIFFYFYNNVLKKILFFTQAFVLGLIFELSYYFITGKELLTTYLRRALFVGPQLFDKYYNYFHNNYIYYRHSKLVSILTNDESYRGITLWFGENVIGKEDLNASVGTFVEGYISFGVIGVIIAGIIFFAFCSFYSSMKLDNAYIGLLFSATGLFRGSFFEPLLLTHGLIIFIIMIILFIPRANPKQNKQMTLKKT
jgi:hypothetical protein